MVAFDAELAALSFFLEFGGSAGVARVPTLHPVSKVVREQSVYKCFIRAARKGDFFFESAANSASNAPNRMCLGRLVSEKSAVKVIKYASQSLELYSQFQGAPVRKFSDINSLMV